MVRRTRVLCAAALALVTPYQSAAADDGNLLVLTVAADQAEVARLGEHLRPLLASVGRTLALRQAAAIDIAEATAPAGAGSWARAFIDLTRPTEALVFFTGPGAQRPVIRGLPLRGKVDAVARAEIGEILLAALAAPGETPPAEVATSLAPGLPGPPARWRTTLGMVAAAEGWAQAAPLVPGVGLSARFALEDPASLWSMGVWALLRYRAPLETTTAPVGVRIQGGEADLLFVLSRALGTRTTLGIAAGLGADARFARPVVPPGLVLMPTERPRELALVARAALLFERSLADRLGLVAALTLDALPLQGRFVVTDEQGARRTIFTPWPLRPGALLGVTWGPGSP
jgi:hypothetical protein